MNLTGTEVRVGMTAAANVSSVNTTGSVTIGTPVAALVYAEAPTVAYSLRMDIAEGEILVLDPETGAVTGSDPGVLQVETATVIAAAGATTARDATIIVTASNLIGSPLTVSVPLLLTDNTAALVATKIRAQLDAVFAINSIFTVGGSGSDVSLTAKNAIGNDIELNISIANGTCAGITAAPTSTNTTAGVIKTQAYRISGAVWDESDFEGQPLPAMTEITCAFVNVITGSVEIRSGLNILRVYSGGRFLIFAPEGGTFLTGNNMEIESLLSTASITIDFHSV